MTPEDYNDHQNILFPFPFQVKRTINYKCVCFQWNRCSFTGKHEVSVSLFDSGDWIWQRMKHSTDGMIVRNFTFTSCTSCLISWLWDNSSRFTIQGCLRTRGAVSRWWGSTCSILVTMSCSKMTKKSFTFFFFFWGWNHSDPNEDELKDKMLIVKTEFAH